MTEQKSDTAPAEPEVKQPDEARRDAKTEPLEADETPAEPGGQSEQARQQESEDLASHDPEAELARMREAMLRMRADMDNREKRLEREAAKARKFALESLLRDLVPVLDAMDQAITAAEASDDDHGLALVRKQAIKVLDSHGLEVLDPVGEPFDPNWHEAMTTQPSEDVEPDTVVQVLQRGYRLNERLIRPARVIVATAA